MYIIFPNDCLTSQSGYIVGKRDESAKIVSIFEVVPTSHKDKIPQVCREVKCSVLGFWCIGDAPSLPQDSTFNLVLIQGQKKEMPRVYMAEKEDEVTIIFYKRLSSFSLLSSTPLSLRPQTSLMSEEKGMKLSCLPLPTSTKESNLDKVLEHVNETSDISWKVASILHPKRTKVYNAIQYILNCLLTIPRNFLKIVASMSRILLSFSEYRFFYLKIVKFMMSLPVFFIQFSLRLSQIQFLGNNTGRPQLELDHTHLEESKVKNYTGNPQNEVKLLNTKKSEIHEKQRVLVVMGNVLVAIILDVLLGITLVYLISSSTLVTDISNNIINYADYAAQLLTQLINWLMGVPGGLKLNKTLTNFLGKFFLYHIYLWQTYLQVIQPYLKPVLQVCILSGCLGLTFLISMASDIFSLLTLHVYFFYVYAARMYSLQIYTIMSLARLFTGKKYSTLRNRVDSLPYDVDRLFIGTILFTILLFLLPTTALFYMVFTSLRLLALFFKFLLSSLTHILNKLPLFGLVLMVVRPDILPGGLHVEIIEPLSNHNTGNLISISPHLPPEVNILCIKLLNKTLSLMQLTDWSVHAGHVTSTKKDSWGGFVKKLLCGQLIYPWIERD